MSALLVLQEGSGAGHSYVLDPRKQAVLSVGRSPGCDICLTDQRASRHHCDIRWNGHNWEVEDLGSTNGTYVNGMEIQRPQALRPGDRLTIGETTLVPREFTGQAPGSVASRGAEQASQGVRREAPARRQADPILAVGKAAKEARARPAITAVYWLVQALVAAGVVCLAAGAFLPWLQVTGSLAQDLQPLLQGLADIVAVLSGQDSILNVSQEIGGLEGYGKLTLLVAIVGMITLVVDILFHHRSVIPGIVYLLSGLMAGGAIAFDLVNYYRFYSQMQDLTLVFGIQLEQVVKVFDQFMDVSVTPMIGLVLTGLGLILLLVGGVGRLGMAFLGRGK